ncbi:MAG: homoserine dehydrogenase [Nitrososphaerales archaeon]|nr:homoserine dehydrogenase [Nitrososphaerales archaeon]
MRLFLIGFGVVNQNFIRLIKVRQKDLIKGFGINPRVVAVADRGGVAVNPQGLDLDQLLIYKAEKGSVGFIPEYGRLGLSPLDIIEDVEADVVIEATPTNIKDGEPALSHIIKAIRMGMHVISTNKGPFALAFPIIHELAEHNGVQLRFSGTVGGGTPILQFAKKCLRGDEIISIRGVLNGTTNYILTRMEEGYPFDQALKEAQRLGIAETDPSLDIDGIDSAAKLVILANWVMKRRVTLKDVLIKGLREVNREDLITLLKQGKTIRLIASANDKIEVSPTQISLDDPLNIKGTLNAVTFSSKYAGDETIIGRGAGGLETASAVLRDLIDIKFSLIGNEYS